MAEAGFAEIPAQASGADWTTVTVARAFTNPVVVAGARSHNPTYDAGQDPATVRVRNVQSSGGQTTFQVQVDEWDYLDGAHSAETISYVVAEAGVHRLAGGAVLEAGTTRLDHQWKTVALAGGFQRAPLVFAQATTYNGRAAVTTRLRSVGTGSFEVRLQEEEGADNWHARETLAYLAVAGGEGVETGTIQSADGWVGARYSNGRGPLLAAVQTYNDPDPATLWASPVYNGVTYLRLDEERSGDDEVAHAAETVGYAVFTGALEAGREIGEPVAARAAEAVMPELDGLAVTVYPNPSAAGAGATVRLTVPAMSEGRVVLYDVLGREAAVLAEGALAAGTAELAVPRGLAPGLYVVRAEAGARTATARFTVTR